MIELFSQAQVPEGFQYPHRLIETAHNDSQLGSGAWWLIAEMPDYAILCLKQTQARSPNKVLIPFAKNDQENILACFDGDERSDNPRVYFDTFSDMSGVDWEQRYSLSFSEWLTLAQST